MGRHTVCSVHKTFLHSSIPEAGYGEVQDEKQAKTN
jgi:hypothetical protein